MEILCRTNSYQVFAISEPKWQNSEKIFGVYHASIYQICWHCHQWHLSATHHRLGEYWLYGGGGGGGGGSVPPKLVCSPRGIVNISFEMGPYNVRCGQNKMPLEMGIAFRDWVACRLRYVSTVLKKKKIVFVLFSPLLENWIMFEILFSKHPQFYFAIWFMKKLSYNARNYVNIFCCAACRCAFSFYLEIFKDGDFLISNGNLFHSLEAA